MTASLNGWSESVSGRTLPQSRSPRPFVTSVIKVGMRRAGVDGSLLAGEPVSYWY
jgi:hypothetical protein